MDIFVSLVFAIVGAVLTGLASNDSKACVSFQTAGTLGTILTGIGIILAAAASW
jgi:NADH:ubiquinone oxidoreductase subunit 5 (subunit L)/multisubunit Na+/H+ antiporter MnhA subunit